MTEQKTKNWRNIGHQSKMLSYQIKLGFDLAKINVKHKQIFVFGDQPATNVGNRIEKLIIIHLTMES
jgi:hypothetical protein